MAFIWYFCKINVTNFMQTFLLSLVELFRIIYRESKYISSVVLG
jgi:hypothetical protein